MKRIYMIFSPASIFIPTPIALAAPPNCAQKDGLAVFGMFSAGL